MAKRVKRRTRSEIMRDCRSDGKAVCPMCVGDGCERCHFVGTCCNEGEDPALPLFRDEQKWQEQ